MAIEATESVSFQRKIKARSLSQQYRVWHFLEEKLDFGT